jgi:hypothetical protein
MRSAKSKNQSNQLHSVQWRVTKPDAVSTLLNDFFDDSPIHVLKQTLTDLATVYAKSKANETSPKDKPFLVENTMYQAGIINDLLSRLADIHSRNESSLKWARTLQNQLN